MLYNCVYYTLTSGVVITSIIGVVYLYNPILANNILINVSWNTLKLFHRIKNKIPNTKKLKTDEENYKDAIVKDRFLGYNTSDDTTYQCDDFESDYLKNNNFDIMIIINKDEEDNNDYYKRIDDKKELVNYNIEKLENIFLQVELEQNDTRIPIHGNLKQFYLKGNKILDKNFLLWYLKKFYYLDLENDYTLHIIDSDINIFTMKKDKSIILLDKENELSYEVVEE